MRDGVEPGLADLFDGLAHADGVDLRVGRQRADHHRHVVFLAAAVDHVGEQERAALVLRHAADELPADERMQLGVLVDRPVDARHQPGRLQRREMLLEVERGAFGLAGAAALVGLIEHCVATSCSSATPR